MTGWRQTVPDGLRLVIRLTPGAARDAVDGVETGADGRKYLKIRVRAMPEKGKANRALIAFVAGQIGTPKSAIRIVSGETARLKTLHINGEPDGLARAADSLAWKNTT
ncbi:DUF167 family protein [Hoeflea poritis]|uniref:DUF167 family protein n=1 Tax=Hoeflea poritis TaxID=2993659 RepID=UPI003CCE4142